MAADRINRVEVELHCGDAVAARAASDRVSRAWGERIAPVVARVCAERGGDVLHRVERLELDLGAIDADALEEQIAARIEDALREALAKALAKRGGRDAHVEAALEVVESVALTGHVPWWAAADAREVAAHFACAAGAAERELVEIVRRVGRDPVAVERLARLSDGQALVRLVERARPEVRGIPRGEDRHERRELIELLVEEGAAPHAQAREVAKESARDAVIAREVARARDAVNARDAAITREAAVAREAAMTREAASTREALSTREAALARADADVDVAARDAVTAEILDANTARDAPSEREAANAASERGREPDAAVAPLVAASEPSEPTAAATPTVPRDAPRPDAPLADLPDRPPAPPPLTAARRPRTPPAATAPTQPPAPPPDVLAARRAAFSRIDELFVSNAGLVILAPFLRHLFHRLGLVDEAYGFIDLPSRYLAVALLGALVDGDPDPLELHLALPKVLCGLALDADYLPPPALAPESLAEGERMIAAVLAQVPELRSSSVDGFRDAFLRREGKLATRDGSYYLVVHRTTYDVLIDRLPWAFSVVRLPWMADTLWVEW